MVHGMTFDPKYDMEYLDRKIVVPKVEALNSEPITVMRDDIDYNKHLNNAQYIRMACEYLPTDYTPQRIRVEYKKPAKLGDSLYPQLIRQDNKIFVLMNSIDATYAVIEFTA